MVWVILLFGLPIELATIIVLGRHATAPYEAAIAHRLTAAPPDQCRTPALTAAQPAQRHASGA